MSFGAFQQSRCRKGRLMNHDKWLYVGGVLCLATAAYILYQIDSTFAFVLGFAIAGMAAIARAK